MYFLVFEPFNFMNKEDRFAKILNIPQFVNISSAKDAIFRTLIRENFYSIINLKNSMFKVKPESSQIKQQFI